MSVSLIISRVQTLWEAQAKSWCDKDYVVGFLSIHNEDIETWLVALGLSYSEQDIILPAVPANTSDLSVYQQNGNLLGDMMLPYELQWKKPGDPPTCFAHVELLDNVLDEDPNSPIEGIESWCWKGGVVEISQSSIATDIRVRCQLLPDVFQSDSDNYIRGATNVLVYGTCEAIAMARGGGASKLAPWFNGKMQKAMDNVEAIFLQQEQLTQRRIAGRRSRIGGPSWRLPRC